MNNKFLTLFLPCLFFVVEINCYKINPIQSNPIQCQSQPNGGIIVEEQYTYDWCEYGSYISGLKGRDIFPFPKYGCNDKLVGPLNYSVIVLKDNREMILNVQAMFYLDGVEVFNSLGTVKGGECDGAFVYILNEDIVTKGGCDLAEGVTQTQTKRAMFVMRGKCDSTCYGSVIVNYRPGIKN